MNYDVIIIGAGYAGSVMAEQYARDGKRVLILEKKSHIGGNAYDYMDMNHIRIHEYGPHLFHTNFKEVVDYLSQFTEWYPYEHRVKGLINDKFVPIPFNLTSIEELFDDYYEFIPEMYMLQGTNTGKQYRLGDRVVVIVESVDIGRREINFCLA